MQEDGGNAVYLSRKLSSERPLLYAASIHGEITASINANLSFATDIYETF